ncbi:MAG: autotransporter-associated beta strand repeat-containing protein [Tepidisphaeraceae bacterium]
MRVRRNSICLRSLCAAAVLGRAASAWAVAWNATNPGYSGTSTAGLSDMPTLFVDENVIINSSNSTRGTATYLGDGWLLSARHVIQDGSNYGALASPSQITYTVDVGGVSQTYTADTLSTPDGSSDISLIHLAGTSSGPIATLPGVLASQIYTGSSEAGSLVQIGGYGYWGALGSTLSTSATFHRAFNIAYLSGGFVDISANASAELVNNGYVMGIAESGDSGGGMWMDDGPASDTNLWDYSLIGETTTSNGSAFGDTNQYGRVSNYATSWILPTAYAGHATVTWDTSLSAGIQEGSGTWDLSTQNFSNGVTNVAWDNSTTQNVHFGAHQGAAGIVTLGANVIVQNMMFDPATSGTYTIAPGTGYSIALSSSTIITTNANATISAAISGGGGTVSKLGSSTLTLSGSNTFTGTLAIGDGATSGGNINGALCVASNAALTNVSTVKLLDNNAAYSTFQLSGNVIVPANVVFDWNANNAGPAAMAANVIENVSGNNTIAGPTTYFVGGIGYGIVSDSGLLTLNGNFTASGTSGKTFYFRGAGNGTIGGVITGTGGNLVFLDSGTWTLNSANTNTGVTTIAAGVLSTNRLTSEGTGSTGTTPSGIGQSNDSASNLVLTGGTLSYTGGGAITDRLFTIGPGGGTLDSSGGGALIFSNTGADVSSDAIAHNASTVSGSNVVTITSAGMADLTPGELVTGTGIPTGDAIVSENFDAGTIALNSPATATGTPSLAFGAVGRTLTLTGTNTNANGLNSSISNSSGGGVLSIVKNGTGNWTLGAAETYTGSTSVNAGILTVAGNASVGGSSASVASGATLANLGTFITPTVTNAGTVTSGKTFSISGTLSNSGSFSSTSILSVGTVLNSGTFSVSGTLNETGNFTNSGTAALGGTQNWSPGTTFTNSAGSATFQTDAGSALASPLSLNVTGGTISLGSPQHLAGISIAAGTTTPYAGTLDIENNHAIISYSGPSPIASIAGYIASGYNGGNWNGTGIISTTAQVPTNGLLYGIGYADGADGVVSGLSSGQIEVMYTLLGDANLDGLVNAADFTILAANFNQPVTGWDQGDFNYDGLVNAADFTDLAANFNQSASGADVSAGDVAALDAFAAANGISPANVPEPGSAAMMVTAGLGILGRRRRSLRHESRGRVLP